MANQDLGVFALGWLQFIILGSGIVLCLVVFVLFRIFSKLSEEDLTEIVQSMAIIWLIVMVVLIFMRLVCYRISPIERFVSSDINEAILSTEAEVCDLVDRVNEFIESDLGQRGQDDPRLLAGAKHDALMRAGGPVTRCPPMPLLLNEVTEEQDHVDQDKEDQDQDKKDKKEKIDQEINDRLSRMERTLSSLVEPQFKSTYDISMRCNTEGFTSDQLSPAERLVKIKETMVRLRSQYLTPIQQKQADLQKGILSDCDKKRGASAAIDVSMS